MYSKFYTKAGFEPTYIWDWGISLSLYGIPGVKRPRQARLIPFSHLGPQLVYGNKYVTKMSTDISSKRIHEYKLD